MKTHAIHPLTFKNEPLERTTIGWIAHWDVNEGIFVDFEANPFGPLPSRSIVAFDARSLERALQERQEVLLTFADNDRASPIIVGLMQPCPQPQAAGDRGRVNSPLEAKIDGKRLLLQGQEEVVLRCGQASITLHRDGRLIIRGTNLQSRSRGQNRITGGSIKIN